MTAPAPALAPEIQQALQELDHALAPLVPEAARRIAAAFPQLDPRDRAAAMKRQLQEDWPLLLERLPFLAGIALPALLEPIPGESPAEEARRYFGLCCYLTVLGSAFLAPDELLPG